MKKFYSIVLMATALLIGTNAWAQAGKIMIGSNEYSSLDAAFKAAQNNDVIYLTGNVEDNQVAWFGEAAPTDENYRSVTLDLGGFTYTSTIAKTATDKRGQNIPAISVTHGKLEIKNGTITNTNVQMDGQDLIRVYGTYKQIDAKTQTPFSHLVIDADVTIQNNNLYAGSGAEGANAITIDQLSTASPNFSSYPFDYVTRVFKKGNAASGLANGVKLEVYGKLIAKKYAIKVNGSVVSSGDFTATSGKNPAAADVAADNKSYSPYIYIGEHASLKTNNEKATSSVAAYSSGYGRWEIHGECEGSTGVYVKSGEVVLKDATIKSNFDGEYGTAQDVKSGVTVAGSGIVMQSSTYYNGDIDVSIEGETKVTGTTGYAVDEFITTSDTQTKVDAITISGGTFESGAEGAIRITEGTAGSDAKPITITGGTVEVNATTIGNQTLEQFLQEQTTSGATETHISYVEGNLVISEGAAPVGDANVAAGHDENSSVKWTGTEEKLIEDLELKELEINEKTVADPAVAVPQTLTIGDAEHKVTFKVGRLVLGSAAKVIVNPGSKLIVTGEQGVAAFVASNIILRNENGERSIFLFHPNVNWNKHPMATVELITNSWYNNADSYQWENFGLPTYGAVESITCEETTAGVVYAEVQVYENSAWTSLGYIGGTYSIPVEKLNKPFVACNIIAFREQTAAAPKVVVTGELVGNVNASLNSYMRWTPFANSYTGEIDGAALIDMLNDAENVAPYFWIAKSSGNGSLAFDPIDEDEPENVLPMQAFLLNNKGTKAEVNTLNYNDAVYAPAMGKDNNSNGAPRRRLASAYDNTAKARVIVTNEQGAWDIVKFRENASNRVAEKYMNDDINIYAMADEKAAILAAENLENTYVGFSTVKGGNFTISFANVEGREFTLIDHETGARVEIAEGNTYEFNADANFVNDYRFEIVGRQNMPTAIDNTEAIKSVKGIYTITGQYVGEMNVWNTLPAGVYVVNGDKRVK